MKVLFYNHTGQVSGAERVMQMILTGMDRSRYQPVVACPDKSRMIELAQNAGVRTRGLRPLEARFTWRLDRLAQYLLSFARVIREARAVVKSETPDLIHANSIRAGLVMAAATTGLQIPVIWHAHDILPRHPLSTLVRLFAVTSSRNHILAVSNAVARRFRTGLLRKLGRRLPVTVVHNAVDLERFHPDASARAEVRRELGIGENQPVVGIVGQLTPRKGQLELVESFATVAREMPECVLLIAGEPLFNRDEEYAKALRKTAESLGLARQIKFLGPRSDVPRLMQALDVLVINSHEEPFALTVLEGLASGIPVLATEVGGTPEMIHSQDNGVVVPARDNQKLAAGLIDLLDDPQLRATMGQNARESAIARFSIDRFLREIASVYSQASRATPLEAPRHNLNEKLATD